MQYLDLPETRIGAALDPQDPQIDNKIMETRKQLNEVMCVMQDNIYKINQRGEKIENLCERAEALEFGTEGFYKTSVEVKRASYWRAYSMYIAALATIAVFVLAGTAYSRM
ncbi:unnamed protein product, partial [Mesorhabditis spiculigera]